MMIASSGSREQMNGTTQSVQALVRRATQSSQSTTSEGGPGGEGRWSMGRVSADGVTQTVPAGDDGGVQSATDGRRPVAPRVEALRATGLGAGLHALGVAAAAPFEGTRADLESRRADGLHGGMAFTYRNPARSTDISVLLPSARSLVVGARGYDGGPTAGPPDRPHGRVARYVRDDAYGALDRGLTAVAEQLRAEGFRAVVVADQNHLVDREAAYRAGLGWYGKSSNLLLPGRGSWFVLGSVVTDADLLPADPPVADGCGSCRRCLDGCPTGAIVAPGVVDARRCLAWLVQSPDPFPVELRRSLGDRLYGCDDCQDVCPPNRLRGSTAGPPEVETPPDGADATASAAWVDLLELLTADDATLLERHGRWYIPKRDPRFLRRTALVVLGNIGDASDPETVRVVDRYRGDPDEMLAEHATWAWNEIRSRSLDRRGEG
jgi:epoxyqueuosine reductase